MHQIHSIMSRFLFILITLIYPFLNLAGKDSHYSYAQLSISEGLSQANVRSILLDQKGNLWVGTKNGLNQYSQQKMENFFHQADNIHSLPDNRILHLEEDSLEQIWVATQNGLAIYNPELKHFSTITKGWIVIMCADSRIQTNSIDYFLCIKSLCINGGVLFGGNNVLYFYNYQTQVLERIHIHQEDSNIKPIEYRVQKILPFKDNKLLIATRQKGFFTYDCQTREIKAFTPYYPGFLLFSACIASDGNVYASYYGNGVCRFDANGEMNARYTADTSPLNNNYVMDILEHDGKLWLYILGLALWSTMISNFTGVKAVRRIGPTLTSILGALQPLTAVILGVLFLDEHLGFKSIAGIVLILTAVLMVVTHQNMKKHH